MNGQSLESEAIEFIEAHKRLGLFRFEKKTKQEKINWFSRFKNEAKNPAFFEKVIELIEKS